MAICIAKQFGEGKEMVLQLSCFTFEITFENYELAHPTSQTSISINGLNGFFISIQGEFLADKFLKSGVPRLFLKTNSPIISLDFLLLLSLLLLHLLLLFILLLLSEIHRKITETKRLRHSLRHLHDHTCPMSRSSPSPCITIRGTNSCPLASLCE